MMKKETFKEIVRKACNKKAFEYLTNKKEGHSKGRNIQYDKLEMQEYLLTLNPTLAKFYFLIKSRMIVCRYNYKNQFIRNLTDSESIREKLCCPLCKLEQDEPLHWTTCAVTSTGSVNTDNLLGERNMVTLKSLLERLIKLWERRESLLENSD